MAEEYDPDEDPRSLDDWVRSALRDSALWPVLLAGLGILSTFGGALLVLALVERNLPALGALALVLVMGGHAAWGAWRSGKRGLLAALGLFAATSSLAAFVVLRWWTV